jgi:hypothetical protein
MLINNLFFSRGGGITKQHIPRMKCWRAGTNGGLEQERNSLYASFIIFAT